MYVYQINGNAKIHAIDRRMVLFCPTAAEYAAIHGKKCHDQSCLGLKFKLYAVLSVLSLLLIDSIMSFIYYMGMESGFSWSLSRVLAEIS